MAPQLTPAERFFAKVEFTDTCWLWRACLDRYGYGKTAVKAHRWVYEFCVGPIPNHLQIDHLCRVRHCVNPDHLELVTSAENTKRGKRGGRTHCVHGHPLFGDNLYQQEFRRSCRQCAIGRQRKWHAKNTLAAERGLDGEAQITV